MFKALVFKTVEEAKGPARWSPDLSYVPSEQEEDGELLRAQCSSCSEGFCFPPRCLEEGEF